MLEKIRANSESKESAAPAGLQMTAQPASVVIYATPNCGYCARARAFFKKHAVSYTEYDITADKRARERYKKLNGIGVPLILVGETRVPGFNEELLRRLLGIR